MVNLLANMVNKINIAHKNKESFVKIRISRLLMGVLNVLQNNGAILTYKILSESVEDIDVKSVIVYLKYYNGIPLISNLEMVSKPSFRRFYSVGQLVSQTYKSNLQGFFVVSTSKGIVSSVDLLSLNKRVSLDSGEILLKVCF